MSNFFQGLPPGLPMPGSFPSPEEVRRDARQLATKLFQDYATLNKIIERHEGTIRTRWSKKSNSQKKKLLLEAWPNMSTHHRPDVEAWRRRAQSKEAYLWPYINLEDLVQRKTMLLLLHFRGRYHPREFIHADLEQAAFGKVSGMTMPAFLNEYTMYFHRSETADGYGELISWDDEEDAFENMTNEIGMHPGHGLQALEIQQRIWAFLVTWSKIILQDIPSLTNGDVSPNPGPPPALGDITSLQMIALEAAYRIPAHLDFARLKAMASAERNAREDHLWALREDPGYFADVMHEASVHRQEQLLDTKGHEHPTLKEHGRPLFWNRVLGSVLVESHFGFATFDEIVRQVNDLASLHARDHDRIKPEVSLPSDLSMAFQNLRFLLNAAKVDLIRTLQIGLFPSPPFRQFCLREPQDPRTSMIRVMYQPPREDNAIKRIMPLFNVLFNDEQLRLFGLHTVTDEIGRLMQSDSSVNALISPWVAGRLSSLTVVSECLHQLHLFKPWSRKIEDQMEIDKSVPQSHYDESFKDWVPVLNVKFEGSQVYRFADPTDGKFDYPVQRRRNKQTVEKLRKAEANLDLFWKAVDQHYKSRAIGKSQQDLVSHLLSSDRAIQRTPEWIEPEKTKLRREEGEYEYQPFSTVFHDPTRQVTGTFNRASLSSKAPKAKTRGDAVPNDETQPGIPHEPNGVAAFFSVDKRAHKVFRTLFHSPNNPDTPGEIPWVDFLHSMVSMGFSTEKLHGSAWNFTPQTPDIGIERSIQFHEPHPSSKIPFLWTRRYGRRLGRAYGWNADTFRLA
ncbi:hypothetical protein HRS9139_04931 [Pyrenophora teres f. teres]|uniref:Uncharacterized protein n=1 Tax=Pyrenophora teres f. teres TaxID=97479 RepID=A0A6S6VZI8_9PLEO|nr:hypothetical protein HRS9139_04931 [Pyrenophora teres f. teres]KAE8848744.1 hypothetical protein HRS9122_02760 [Pyrenophora teres f. teres]CAE7030436.1 hypothetical protein PTTW11_04526 [Pyrenophora teres f. teres]